jgi:hypothetical protein
MSDAIDYHDEARVVVSLPAKMMDISNLTMHSRGSVCTSRLGGGNHQE